MAFNIDSNYDHVDCCVCKINFFIPSQFHSQCIKNNSDFYCPAGHALCYPKQTEDTKVKKIIDLQEQLAAATKTIEVLSKNIKRKKRNA